MVVLRGIKKKPLKMLGDVQQRRVTLWWRGVVEH